MESICASAAPSPQWGGHGGMPSSEVEGILIDRTLQGWNDAFGDLIQPHLTPLNRFARMRLRSDSGAEDVVQQTVLRALSHLRQFRREASFKTWLSAIALNEVIHVRRRRAVALVLPLHEARTADLAGPSPYVLLQQREQVERLHRAVARLPEKYRTMIQLRDLHELSVAETARSLSLTVSAVKTRHHRARKLLFRSLAASNRGATSPANRNRRRP